MSEAVRKEALYYLSLDEDDLLFEIGRRQRAYIDAMGRIPVLEAGREWFQYQEVLLYERLCLEAKICKKLSGEGFKDEVTMLLAVADIICGVLIGIPPFVVAALLMKMGLSQFCNCTTEMHLERRKRLLGCAVIWYSNLAEEIRQANNVESETNGERLTRSQEQLRQVYRVISALYRPEQAELLNAYLVPIPDESKSPMSPQIKARGRKKFGDKYKFELLHNYRLNDISVDFKLHQCLIRKRIQQ